MESLVTPAFWQGKNVLITGHTGFKGSWLTLWLEQMGAKVSGISLANPEARSQFALVKRGRHIQDIECDIRDKAALEAHIAAIQPEMVFHLAAQALVSCAYDAPWDNFTSNVSGTLNLLEALRDNDSVQAILVVTTDKVYANDGVKHHFFKETDALGGQDPYSASKAMTEILCASWRESFMRKKGVPLATARAGNVIGGGDWAKDRLIPDYYRARDAQQTLQLRYPDAVRPWQHVLESLRGYLLYAEYLLHNRDQYVPALNFGPSMANQLTVKQVLEALSAVAQQAPDDVQQIAPANSEALYLNLDSTQAAHTLGWHPALNMSATLRLTHAWYAAARGATDMRDFAVEQLNDYLRTCGAAQ